MIISHNLKVVVVVKIENTKQRGRRRKKSKIKRFNKIAVKGKQKQNTTKKSLRN